eukprot:TRINITY_DN2792_c0_g1_i3.p1 TRINITY_DN2792_c0_g1~~TRINITY_DN2792_c0_g1_i3.p1  ORF type:complete len:275 (+),score=77.49 TRINITY_DN2792_c0_g1_i3:68-826(+)
MEALLSGYLSDEGEAEAEAHPTGTKRPAAAPARPRKRRKKAKEAAAVPELPEMFKPAAQGGSDTAKGRTRHVEHWAGMWSGYVYLPCDPATADAMREVLSEPLACPSANWAPIATPHVSLSRQLYMQQHDVALLSADLAEALKGCAAAAVTFTHWQVLRNDEGNTEFLAVVTHDACVAGLLEAVDDVVAAAGHLRYYRDPVLHATLATRPVRGGTDDRGSNGAQIALARSVEMQVDAVLYKAGNKHSVFPLL